MSAAMSNSPARKDQTWNFRAVGAFVAKATSKAREKQGLHAAEIVINWPAIVGPDLAAYTAPRRIRWPKAPDRLADRPSFAPGSGLQKRSGGAPMQKTTLEIWVAGGRAHEIPYLKGPIMARINAYFGYRAITDILPVDGPVLRPRLPKARPAITAAELGETAKAHNIKLGDPLGEALAKLGANIRRGKG
jgi:hypothetical protein